MKLLKLTLSKLLLVLATPFVFVVGGVLFIIFMWNHKCLIGVVEILQEFYSKKTNSISKE